MINAEESRPKQQEDQVTVIWISAVAGTTVALVALVILVAYLWVEVSGQGPLPPAPQRLGDRVGRVLRTLIAPTRGPAPLTPREPDPLENFAWVDRRQRLASIPIDAAMDMVARGQTP